LNLSPRGQQLIALQQIKYLQSLPEKKARLELYLAGVRQHGWTPESFNEFKLEIHRLTGSAGSYGLVSLGSVAQKLDVMLADSKNSKVQTADFTAEFLCGMDDLFQELDEVLGSLPELIKRLKDLQLSV
jgi:HPt (histidine-containing phosphotransfer) domain-containing protein